MLAEDEKITALELKIGLRKFGYNVFKVVDKGLDLIKEAFQSDPDVIVSDVRLKDDINGLEAISEILSRKRIPIVIIQKPCSAMEINNVINNCLSN